MQSGTRYKNKDTSFNKLKYTFLVPKKNQTNVSTLPENDKGGESLEGERPEKKSNLGNIIGHIIAIVGLILIVLVFLAGFIITTYNTPINEINTSFKSLNTSIDFLLRDSTNFKSEIKDLRDKYDKINDGLNNFKNIK